MKYLSGGEIVTEDWNQSINYRDSFLLTLKEGFKLDFNGSKEIPIWVELQTDENPYNDTTNIILEIDKINDENGVYPLTENFENRELPVNWISRNTIPVSPWNITNQIQASGQTGRVLSLQIHRLATAVFRLNCILPLWISRNPQNPIYILIMPIINMEALSVFQIHFILKYCRFVKMQFQPREFIIQGILIFLR
ncbi:MAG: hypothetical protein IPH93_12075 [Saprospiraceae bacterium]|nr:hypothetical protein [Saprospiraceae bacterium]